MIKSKCLFCFVFNCVCVAAVFGQLANLIPRVYTYYFSTVLFAIFGAKMLYDGCRMSPDDAQEEFDEVQSDLKKREDEVRAHSHRNRIDAGNFSVFRYF